jgi:hypothetical protein
MLSIKRLVLWPFKKVLRPLARPVLARLRQQLAGELDRSLGEMAQVRREWAAAAADIARLQRMQAEVWAELTRMHQVYLDYHAALTQQIADEVARLRRPATGDPKAGDDWARAA